tara:strand:- start:86 stop:466 length:381 start_codon:yes stop_codon:yes gene_type:complete
MFYCDRQLEPAIISVGLVSLSIVLWLIGARQEDPVFAMNPLYTNGACLPTTNRAATCSPGYLADYVIMAKTKQHVAAGVKFAREYNLRLVVRNTGHDFSAYFSSPVNIQDLGSCIERMSRDRGLEM